MKSHKFGESQVSDLLNIAICVYKDAVAKCSISQDPKDIVTMSHRIQHEGIQFLTVTLPAFGRDFDKSLDTGQIIPSHFRSFRKCGAIPSFLKGMLGLVFNPFTGRLFNEPCKTAIEGIRQFANTFKKLELPYSAAKLDKAVLRFREDEQSFRDLNIDTRSLARFRDVSRACWYHLGGAISSHHMVPKHGPGAVGEHISGNQKYVDRHWHRRLEPFFPFYGYKVHNESVIVDENFDCDYEELDVEQERPVRVVFVPKDSKGPRTIAIEPTCMQYTQQAVSRYLIEYLESNPFTSGHINFTDQKVNQLHAMESSKTGLMATLDLSSASDRVSHDLVDVMLQSAPMLLGAVEACRSKTAKLPDGEIISLQKFASMGSALCFPIESMFFYTLCIDALLESRNLPPTVQNCRTVGRDVYVYGDDIIVPVRDVDTVVGTLQRFNCIVNTNKSYWNGKFRESCGVDAYDGDNVTPTYLRCLPPTDRRCHSNLISWTKTSNLFYRRGYWGTADLLMKKVEQYLGTLPVVLDTCAGLGKTSYQGLPISQKGRWDKKIQAFFVKTWVPTPVYRSDPLTGYPALLKCLLRLESGNNIQIDPKHLERSARHGVVTLKCRWIQPY